jgi:hypothetical protein
MPTLDWLTRDAIRAKAFATNRQLLALHEAAL